MVDIAFKVVGIGSVGTRAFVVLLLAEDGDPLILQVKEARKSVLEPFAGAGPYQQQGRRVVEGQRLTQAASDIFLGWFTGADGNDYYVRQLRDMKYAYDPSGSPLQASRSTHSSAGGTWRGPTRSPATRPRSPGTSGRPTRSTARSSRSRGPTRSRTTGTTRRSARP